jgi:hypothetical protein
VCAICCDERQYVGFDGQKWTTLEDLRASNKNIVHEEEPRLTGIRTTPAFAIGQRALVIESSGGNVLWDCIALIDEATIAAIKARGGLKAIAISHPHYYTTMVEWSRAFGGIPVYLHSADRKWVMRTDPCVKFWEGEQHSIGNGITLVRCGGHFDGGTVLHWSSGATGRGALLTGDILQVVPDRRWVSFMYSYPNYIPLGADAVRKIAAAVEPYSFDRIYGAFHSLIVQQDGKAAVKRSVERYLKAIGAAATTNRSG